MATSNRSILPDALVGAQWVEMDTSDLKPVCLLVTEQGRYIKLSLAARVVLESLQVGHSYEAIAQTLTLAQGHTTTAEEVEIILQHLLQQIQEISVAPLRQKTFWWSHLLVRADVVERWAKLLSIAFHPAFAVVIFAGIMPVTGVVLGWWNLHLQLSWPAVVLFLLSVLVHELGHATACVRYGAKPSEIGFGIYLIYPVLYSNVSDVWRLKRWQRAIVDAGGLYFQFALAAAYATTYLLSGWEAFRAASLMIMLGLAFNLNPVLKFDGYWAVADLLGVTNLSEQPLYILRYVVCRLKGKVMPPLPWPSRTILVLLAYSMGVILFWINIVIKILPWIWQMLYTLPQQIMVLLNSSSRKSDGILSFGSYLMMALVVVVIINLFLKFAQWVWSLVLRRGAS